MQPTPSPPKTGFRLGFDLKNWRNWLLIAAGVIGLISSALIVQATEPRPGDDPAAEVGYFVGTFIGSLLCVWLVPLVLLVAARVMRDGSRGRAIHTAAAVVAISVAILQLTTFFVAAKRGARLAAQRAADRALAETADLRREIAKKNESGSVSEKDIDRLSAASDKVAAALDGTDKSLAEMMRGFNAFVLDAIRPVVKAQETFVKAGALAPETLMNKGSLSERAAIARANKQIAADAVTVLRTLNAKIDELAKSHGVSTEQREAFRRGALGNGRGEQLLRIRELDVEFYGHAERYLTILHDSYGKWSVTDGDIHFEDDDVLAAFNAVADPLITASEEQINLMKLIQQKPPTAGTPPAR